MRQQLVTALILCTVLTTSLPAFAAGPAAELHLGNGGEPQTLDPHRYNLRLEETLLTDLFVGLTTMNGQGEIVPGAAVSWAFSPDGLRWTFTLRQNQVWSDGRPLVAADFVYSFRRLLDPRTAASLAYFMYPLKNAQAVNAGELPPAALGVSAPDDLTLVLELHQPYPQLLERLLYPTGYPVPRHVIEAYGDDWVKPANWVSNGAYRLAEWRPQAHVKLTANERFFDPPGIRNAFYHPLANEQNAYNRYRAGEMHAVGGFPATELDQVRANMAEHLRTSPLLSMIYLVFNTQRPPFDDVRVREALALVVRQEILTDKVQRSGNQASYSFVPTLVANYDSVAMPHFEIPIEEREERARDLLAAAGFGPENPLEVTLRYFDSPAAKRSNLAIASFWKRIGVSAKLHQAELKVHFSDLRQNDFEVALAGWVGENNPGHYLDLLVSDAGNVNYGRFSNPDYDALMGRARASADPAERSALMRQAESLANRHFAVVPLWSTSVNRLVNPRLGGWFENPRDVHPVRFLYWRN